MAHTLLCGAMQAESIKSSDKHFDSAVSWYEKAISFLPEEERAKPVKQQMQVCWLHVHHGCTVLPRCTPLGRCLLAVQSLHILLQLQDGGGAPVQQHSPGDELPARLCSKQYRPQALFKANTTSTLSAKHHSFSHRSSLAL